MKATTHTILKNALAILLLFSSFSLASQDRLLLMNGKHLEVSITDDSGANVFFDAKKKNGKFKSFKLYKGDLFSITKAGEKETILYAQDEIIGNEYTVEEMRYFLHGEDDARKGFKTWPTAVGGFVYGAVGTGAVGRGLVPLLFPITYGLGMQIPVIRIRKETISNPDFKAHETYKEGYNKVARNKKMLHSLLYSTLGVASAWTVIELTE